MMTQRLVILISLLLISFHTFAAPHKPTLKEEDLYVEVIKSYRLRNSLLLKKNVEQFVQAHPKSPFADNALYLRGQLLMQNRLFTEAIQEFQKVQDRYPRSNKMVSALFSKGQAYRKLNLFDYAEKTFRSIKKDYPGSPEAERVDLELKLVEVQRVGSVN